MFRGVYIDDEDTSWATLLNVRGPDGIEFTTDVHLGPLQRLVEAILALKPDVVALDYRLDENQDDYNGENTYRAGGPAQLLREAVLDIPSSDFPIILISTEQKIRSLFRPDETAHDLFDEWYQKEQLSNKDQINRISHEILALAVGYKRIVDNLDTKDKHLTLLDIGQDEWDEIRPETLRISVGDVHIAHVLARILLRDVIKRTGILLPEHEIISRLGLSPTGEGLPTVFEHIEATGGVYTGVFGSGWKRIWRHRFDHWFVDQFGKPSSSLTGLERANLISELLGHKFDPAVSKWSGSSEEFFAFSCSSCDHPTELRHSVAAHDPIVPKYVDRKRICFDCVGADKQVKRDLIVAPEDEAIREKIIGGEIARPK